MPVLTSCDGLGYAQFATVPARAFGTTLARRADFVGQFAQAIVWHKIQHNRFLIKTDKPRVEVSWQVTGIRRDAYAETHRIPVVEDKPTSERGTYLHPEAFKQKRITTIPSKVAR